MLKMEWDPELAYVAQMHANQCQFQHDCYECRRTDHHSTMGQNLYIYQTSQSSIDTQWRYVVKEWFDEIKIAPPVVAQSFDLFNLNIGHFTQVAWASTNRVGCGIVTYDVNEQDGEDGIFKTAQLYTCNYALGGNFLGEKMYEDGHPVIQCPSRYGRSKRFTSLCEYSRAKVNINLPPNKKNKKTTKVTKKVITTTTTTRTRFNTASINNFQAEPVNQNENNLFPSSSLQPSVQPSTSLQPSTSFQPSSSSLTPSTTSLLPSTSIISSSPLQPSSTPSLPSATTRRVTSTNRTNRKPTKRPSSTKPGTTAVAVTQSNKRVSN